MADPSAVSITPLGGGLVLGDESSSTWWMWALTAIGAAGIAGVILKSLWAPATR